MIKNGSVVSLQYLLTNDSGEELDRGTKEEPFTYLHGQGQIIKGLENALAGLTIGAKKKVTIPPKDAYGEVNPNLRISVKKDLFPKDFPLKKGVQFDADLGDGKSGVFTVLEVGTADVKVDGNHPLAGQTLTFDVEVLGVREATKQELEHGHAHGDHGHDH